VPLDGVLVYGTALVSVAHITGEALPVPKNLGDEIPAGAAVTVSSLGMSSIVKKLRNGRDLS